MLIDGKKIAAEIFDKLSVEVKNLSKKPRMAAILVGNEGNGRKFLEVKKRAAEKVGIEFKIYEFPKDISNKELRKNLVEIAKESAVNGVIVELPLPKKLDTQYILDSIPEEKDPDVLTEKAQNSFFAGKSKVPPPAVEAVKTVLESHNISLKGKKCVVFGFGILVGKPVSHWLGNEGAKVSIVNEFTKKPENISKEADILISGVGKPNLIRKDMVRDGVIVIDFGFNQTKNGVVGDVNREIQEKASLFTPVPGGVGPLVVAAVLKNLVILSKN